MLSSLSKNDSSTGNRLLLKNSEDRCYFYILMKFFWNQRCIDNLLLYIWQCLWLSYKRIEWSKQTLLHNFVHKQSGFVYPSIWFLRILSSEAVKMVVSTCHVLVVSFPLISVVIRCLLTYNVSYNGICSCVVENRVANKITARKRGQIGACWRRLQMVSQGKLTA